MTCVMVSLYRWPIYTIKLSHDEWSIGQTINQTIWGDATRWPNVEILIASTMREESAMRWLKSRAAVRAVGIGTGLRVSCEIGTGGRRTGLLGFVQTWFINEAHFCSLYGELIYLSEGIKYVEIVIWKFEIYFLTFISLTNHWTKT